MLYLAPIPPLAEVQKAANRLTAEELIELELNLRPMILMQEWPDVTLHILGSMYIPPHQRLMLQQAHRGLPRNVFVASRGTAKTSTVCGLYPTYSGPFFPRRTSVILSATGFRGGQFIMLDMEKWMSGGWDSQSHPADFFRACIPNAAGPVKKLPSFWSMEFDSFSKSMTLPTKDQDMIRGVRGHELYIDEANTADKEMIDKVAEPFLNVLGDMRHGGAYAKQNRVFYVSTIDFNWRPFQERIGAARKALREEMDARICALKGDWDSYDKIDQSGALHSFSFTKFDYTDTLIRRHITNRAGKRFQVNYPDTVIPLTVETKGIPFTERGEDGRMKLMSSPTEFYQTYGLDRKLLEGGIRSGTVDQAGWLAEQRNITDTESGDVFSNELINRVTCDGDHAITPYKKMGEAWRKAHQVDELDYSAPVLWNCADPCVLGVDYAPVSDFCAFTVIRVGPLATEEFNPFTHHGKTEWSNVIWAEQHQRMSAREVADKIRRLTERYNIVYFYEPHKTDPWEVCRGIGLDMRGGGTAIRDELCWLSNESVPPGQVRMFDPLDKDERIRAFDGAERAIPILDTIWPSDTGNDKLVEYAKGQMEQGLLYIGKYIKVQHRQAGNRELHVGYEAVQRLGYQLRKIRQRPTANARQFYMEGDTEKDKNKKDLFSSFLYAEKQVRAHIIRQRQIDNTPPPMGVAISRVGTGRPKRGLNGKAPGSKY